MTRSPWFLLAAVILAACGGSGADVLRSNDSQVEQSDPTEVPTSDPDVTLIPLTQTPTSVTTALPTTSTATAPTTTAAPELREQVCMMSDYDGNCALPLDIYEDAGCPRITADDLMSYPVRIAVMPCEYGFWVMIAELELARRGYAVTADGYYSSFEVPAVQRAQTDGGVEADGQIGPATWNAVMEAYQCDAPLSIRYDLLVDDDCFYDSNGDGMWAPGDLIPD